MSLNRAESNSGKRRPVAAKRQSRESDIAGILILAMGLVMMVGLLVGDAGILGGTVVNVFLTLFGRGAWAAPIVCIAFGLSLLLGKKSLDLKLFGLGLLTLFLTSVGWLGNRIQGDLFDPERVLSNGGYIGAMMAWSLTELLGSARNVGFVALACIGSVLLLDRPLRSLVAGVLKQREVAPKPKKSQEATLAKQQLMEEERRESLLRRTVEAVGTAVIDADIPAAPTQSTKKEPVIREIQPSMSLATSAREPKEGYQMPNLNMLQEAVGRVKRSPEEMRQNIETLEDTLEQFKIEANVVEVATGPTITRYEIQLGPGVRVNRITGLADNMAMNLAASHVRVEAPIPGKAAIGIEVPNSQPTMVTLREVCEAKAFLDSPSRLYVALGQDVSGVNRYCDLTKMPHLLIAGATNSGKSIGLATIITSLLLRNTPKDVRMVMIDPKRVELSLFDGIPHLMCPVVKDVKEAPGVLRAVWREMDDRYDRFSEVGVRNIEGWNEKASFSEKLPYIVVVIDELADLMIQAAAEVETSIVRLAQLARAVGIHLVIATQRPSADVITGTIKTNIPSRIAFSVASQIDSRIILDQGGAEKLVGKGDMLYLSINDNKPIRIQGCYVSEKEIDAVCKHWRQQEAPRYVLNPIEVAIKDREAGLAEETEGDPLWEEAVRWVVDKGQASTSMLQRRFSIGFQRASRLLDMMEERRIVGPRDGPRPREVLMDPMQVESLFGRSYADQDLNIDPLD